MRSKTTNLYETWSCEKEQRWLKLYDQLFCCHGRFRTTANLLLLLVNYALSQWLARQRIETSGAILLMYFMSTSYMRTITLVCGIVSQDNYSLQMRRYTVGMEHSLAATFSSVPHYPMNRRAQVAAPVARSTSTCPSVRLTAPVITRLFARITVPEIASPVCTGLQYRGRLDHG